MIAIVQNVIDNTANFVGAGRDAGAVHDGRMIEHFHLA